MIKMESKSQIHIAVIDDDSEWLNIINEKLLKEFGQYGVSINLFDDFEKFYRFEDINKYNIIITDYYFNCYNLDTIGVGKILKDFKGEKVLITGNPNAVTEKSVFHKILNKSYLMRPTFKFSKVLNLKIEAN